MAPRSQTATHDGHPRRWFILFTLMGIMLMPPIDASALNVAVPVLKESFGVPLSAVAWVPLIYLLIIGSLILPMGRIGDVLGFRRVFLAGVAVFTVASLLCGLAPSLPWLIAARTIQGVGASMMMALNSAITTALFSVRERGRALGVAGMGIAIGLVIGPTLGGALVAIHWSWIFFINVPIGVIGGLLVWRALPHLGPHKREHIDWVGTAFIVTGLGALLLAITQGELWGWLSPLILGLVGISVVCGSFFVLLERRLAEPILDLGIFRNPVFAGANVAAMMNYLGQYFALFLTPLLLQEVLAYSPGRTGLVMATIPVAVLVLAPVSGALSDRLGTRWLAVAGETIMAVGLIILALVVPSHRLERIVPALAMIGIGAGLFQSPNNSAVMGSVPRHRLGVGGGVLATMRNLGMAFGIAISSAVVALVVAHAPAGGGEATLAGIRVGYLVGAGFVLLGALTSAARQDHPAHG